MSTAHPLELSPRPAPHLQDKRPRAPERPFSASPKRASVPSSLEEDLTDSLKHLLNEAKALSLPIPLTLDPAPQASLAVDSVSWQPTPQVADLLEKMVNLLTYVDEKGIQTTTLQLDLTTPSSPMPVSATLTITEYSTAPKVFNIQLAATPEAVAFFAPHAAQLHLALNQGLKTFSVERLELELLDPRYHQDEEEEEDA